MKRIAVLSVIVVAAIAVMATVVRRHATASVITSGVAVGENLASFRPWHASGADKGTMECPVCKYPSSPAVQVWVNGDDESNVLALAAALDRDVAAYKKQGFKAFVVYANVSREPFPIINKRVAEEAVRSKLKNVALVVVSSSDTNAVSNNQINPDPKVRNTVFVYKKVKVAAKFINLQASASGIAALDGAVKRVLE